MVSLAVTCSLLAFMLQVDTKRLENHHNKQNEENCSILHIFSKLYYDEVHSTDLTDSLNSTGGKYYK